jgi:hypothetical protein
MVNEFVYCPRLASPAFYGSRATSGAITEPFLWRSTNVLVLIDDHLTGFYRMHK